jgi:hypothetical protein
MLGLSWVHPEEMPSAESSVSMATWLPRVADFEGYVKLFEEAGVRTPEESVEDRETVLVDRNMNVADETKTPVVRRKTQSTRRKSVRKTKAVGDVSDLATPTYKPRKSKYDIT